MKNNVLKYFIRFISVPLSIMYLSGCQDKTEDPQPIILSAETQIATQWADMTCYIIKHSNYNSPTYSSRSLAYMGIGMYEAVVNGSPTHKSLEGQLSGLMNLPKPEIGKAYNWTIVLNTSQAALLKWVYLHTSQENKNKIDSLEKAIYGKLLLNEKQDIAIRSVDFGTKLANTLIFWSNDDGGHLQQLATFDFNYKLPEGEGYWIPPIRGGQVSVARPMHPHWGKNRMFVMANSQLPIPKPIAYSKDMNSAYYKQMLEVHETKKKLTQEQKESVMWWSDDPAVSAAPPGHSYNLATIAIKKTGADIYKAAETYARVGIAVADAFISCWKCKYTYHAERPSSFIDQNIEKDWLPFFAEPPFPAFVSGHSVQIAAATTVLASIYGDKFAFTDNTYEDRAKDTDRNVEFKNRSFTSFSQVAEECAMSRLYGNIHTRQDNEVGLAEGKKIGANINALKWKK